MKHLTTILSVAALACAFVASPGLAADVVSVEYSDAGVQFTPNLASDYFQLRVSGPEGLVFTQNDAFFSLADELGALPDGTYAWEVVTAPSFDTAPYKIDDSLRGLDKGFDREIAEQVSRASGSFSIRGGVLVDRDLEEPVAVTPEKRAIDAKANVVNQDQVVLGSLCVGVDCANSPVFGFDTIRMKENNLRLKVDDTSSSASFPNNDWMLTFNDSNNGGQNKFSVEDISGNKTPFTILAGAPSNSLYVKDDGHIGIGNNTAVVELHVTGGNSPTFRLEQDGSSGFTEQTWDISGNEANFFVRDVTDGSKLPFRIKPGAGDDALFINSGDGDIGMGTASPAQDLHIKRDGGVVLRMENTAASNSGWDFAAFNNGTMVFSDPGDGNAEFVLTDAGDATFTGDVNGVVFNPTSDRNMKEGFAPIDPQEVLAKVANMELTTWSYIADVDSSLHMGPTAQDFHAAFGLGSDNRRISTTDADGVALASIQALNSQLEEKNAEIESLAERVAALEALIRKAAAE